MSKYPLISIITPLFNTEKYISKTIKSVINQTYQNWELIIIDDKSADRGKDIVRNFLDDKRIKLISSVKNKGPAKTRNLGLSIAKGRFVSFLDSDDIWFEKKLELQIKYLSNNSEISVCYSQGDLQYDVNYSHETWGD